MNSHIVPLAASEVKVELDSVYGVMFRSEHDGTVGQLVAVLALEDAITLAKAILAFAVDEDEEAALDRQYEAMTEGHVDAVSAHWGFD